VIIFFKSSFKKANKGKIALNNLKNVCNQIYHSFKKILEKQNSLIPKKIKKECLKFITRLQIKERNLNSSLRKKKESEKKPKIACLNSFKIH